ncbi:MAG: hypothetical protein U0869_15395 [Chloroflexota bacterium]
MPLARFGDQLLYVGNTICADKGQVPPCDAPGEPPFLETAPDAFAPHTDHPLPVDAQVVLPIFDGPTLWLTTEDPDGLWRTTDLDHWERIDLASVAPAPLAGQAWHASTGSAPIITADGVSLLNVFWHLDDPGRLVGAPGVAAIYPERIGDGVYQLRQSDWRGPVPSPSTELGTVRVEVDADGLRFRSTDGGLLSELPGLGQAFVDDWAAHHAIGRSDVVRIGPDGMTVPTLPGRPVSGYVAVLPVAGGWLAAALDGDPGPVLTWRSVDGATWAPGPPLGDADGPFQASSVVVDGWHRAPTLVVGLDEAGSVASTDGEHWEPIPSLSAFLDTTRLSSGGWLRWQWIDAPQVSTDGSTWQPASDLTQGWVPDFSGESGTGFGGTSSIVDDARFRLVDQENAPFTRDVWILDFAPAAP